MPLPGYALVTGAGSGLGRGIALAFAASCTAGVVFADIDVQAAAQVAALSTTIATNPKYRVLTIKVDVTAEKDVDDMVESAVKEFGRIDYGVNCAGECRCVPIPDLSPSRFLFSLPLQFGRAPYPGGFHTARLEGHILQSDATTWNRHS
ncbi:MAG: hypothetical protein Q9179_005513 [Wetmoreana sp. 5 TL-2023]